MGAFGLGKFVSDLLSVGGKRSIDAEIQLGFLQRISKRIPDFLGSSGGRDRNDSRQVIGIS